MIEGFFHTKAKEKPYFISCTMSDPLTAESRKEQDGSPGARCPWRKRCGPREVGQGYA